MTFLCPQASPNLMLGSLHGWLRISESEIVQKVRNVFGNKTKF
jgi:hypothetical protein